MPFWAACSTRPTSSSASCQDRDKGKCLFPSCASFRVLRVIKTQDPRGSKPAYISDKKACEVHQMVVLGRRGRPEIPMERAYMKGRFHSAAQGSANAGPDKGPAQRKGHTVNKRLADAHDADKKGRRHNLFKTWVPCFHIDCKSSPHLPAPAMARMGRRIV